MTSAFDALAIRSEALVRGFVAGGAARDGFGPAGRSAVRIGDLMVATLDRRQATAGAAERSATGVPQARPSGQSSPSMPGGRVPSALQIIGARPLAQAFQVDEENGPGGGRTKAGGAAPSGGRAAGGGTARQASLSSARGAQPNVAVRRKEALAAGAQPAVVKIVSSAGGAARVRALLSYLGTREEASKDGGAGPRVDIEIRNERGEVARSAAAREAILAEWSPDFNAGSRSRDVGRFQLDLGSTPTIDAVREALTLGFAGRRFAFVVNEAGEGGRASVDVALVLTGAGRWLDPSRRELAGIERVIADGLGTREAGAVALTLQGTGHGREGAVQQLGQVSRAGSRALCTDGAAVVEGEGVRALAQEWGRALRSRAPRDVFHIVFSAREGTDAPAFARAVQAVLDREFAGHPYVFAPHGDRRHVHVHALVKARGDHGRKLDPRIPDLARYREALAEAARENGIAMVATTRAELGAGRPYTLAHARLVERGAASQATSERVDAKRTGPVVGQQPTRAVAQPDVAARSAAATARLQAADTASARARVEETAAFILGAARRGAANAQGRPDVPVPTRVVETGRADAASTVSSPEGTPSSTPLRHLMESLMAAKTSREIGTALNDMKGILGEMRSAVPDASRQTFEAASTRLLAAGEARLRQAVVREAASETAARSPGRAGEGAAGTGSAAAASPAVSARAGRSAEPLRTDEALPERELAAMQQVQTRQDERGARTNQPRKAAEIAEQVRARRERDVAERTERTTQRERAMRGGDAEGVRNARERARDHEPER